MTQAIIGRVRAVRRQRGYALISAPGQESDILCYPGVQVQLRLVGDELRYRTLGWDGMMPKVGEKVAINATEDNGYGRPMAAAWCPLAHFQKWERAQAKAKATLGRKAQEAAAKKAAQEAAIAYSMREKGRGGKKKGKKAA